MKTLELPYIRFGRSKNNVTDFYTILEQSPSIPHEIIVLFRDRIAKSIQWENSEGAAKYSDCFLIWRIDRSNFLFAKLADAGNDSLNRNHSIQMDAVYLTAEHLPETVYEKAEFFATLCFPSVWKDWELHKTLQPIDESEQNVTKLAEKISVFFSNNISSDQSLFLDSHRYYTPSGIDRIIHDIYNNDKNESDKNLLKQQSTPMKIKPDDDSVSSPENLLLPFLLSTLFSPAKFATFMFILLLILGIAGTGWTAHYWYHNAQNLQTDYNTLQEKYNVTTSSLTVQSEELKEEIKDLNKELINTKNIVKEQLQQIQKNDSEIKRLEHDKNNLIFQLQTARQNADESLKIENESLKTQNEQLHKKINLIHNFVEKIHRELFPEKQHF
ncbi:MAG: hypothetical protein LBP87_10270 [Planctomycetaceae bacterium]|jgi:ATP-dependent Lon protease|nr:hypothetical protein [Planctomycetaceae bacterium]